MKINKAWDWSQVKNPRWYIPSEDSYYLLHHWSDKGYTTFLDLGCGRGRHALQFAQHGFQVYATDLSELAIEELNTMAKTIELDIKTCVSDMTQLPYADNSFDCLMAYHVISHSTTEGVQQALSEIHRVVKNNGECFITFGSIETLKGMTRGYHYIEPNVIVKEEGAEVGIPHFYTDRDTLANVLSEFDIISVRNIQNIDLVNNKQYGYHYFVHASIVK